MHEIKTQPNQEPWPKNSLQYAFVEGMRWWQFHHNGSTAFPSERDEAEAEAIRRYGSPTPDMKDAQPVESPTTQWNKPEVSQLLREIRGEHDRLSVYDQCACWICCRINEVMADE